MSREIVTSENREEYINKKMNPKSEKTTRAKVKEHIERWKKNGDLKDVSDEGGKALADAIHSHHGKDMKPHESKLAQISGYGKRFDSREYFKMAHAANMHKGGVLKETGDSQHPDMFTDSGHSILKSYFDNKI
jgi:hypothetical protein